MTKDNFAGGSPAASHFLLLRQNKVTKEKATPVYRPCGVPCVAQLIRRLRNSHCVLKQSSPTPPDQSALLGGAQGRKKRKPKTEKSSGQQVAHHRLEFRIIIYDFVGCNKRSALHQIKHMWRNARWLLRPTRATCCRSSSRLPALRL